MNISNQQSYIMEESEFSDGDAIFNDVLQLYMKHNWTNNCLEDVCKLINIVPGATVDLPSTKYTIFKHFRDNCCTNISKQYYIKSKSCQTYRNEQVCSVCKSVLKAKECNFFAYMPIENQLKIVIEKNWERIINFDVDQLDDGHISDVQSGKILQTLHESSENSDANIISLALNTDGANKFKCNRRSIWPIQIVLNCLPPNLRYEPLNLLTVGVFYGLHKPDCLEFFQPLINAMKRLKEDGFTIRKDDEEYSFVPIITHCIVDLPAKHMLQCIKQYNGKKSCTYCTHPGECLDVPGSRKMIRYTEMGVTYPLRNSLDTMASMARGNFANNRDGTTDISCLVSLPKFDLINGFGIDYMHCVMGIMRKLLNLYLLTKSYKKAFYINKEKSAALEKRLLSIKPIREITRTPRSLDQRADYKASELKYLLLYYLPVCMIDIIPRKYVSHLQLLSSSIYTSLKSNITPQELIVAEKKLRDFVDLYQILFEKKNMVMNIHLLTHLVESVKNLGPLWAYSAFPFEKNNGCLLKLVKGKTDVIHQITNKYIMKKSLDATIQHKKSNDTIFLGKHKLKIQ